MGEGRVGGEWSWVQGTPWKGAVWSMVGLTLTIIFAMSTDIGSDCEETWIQDVQLILQDSTRDWTRCGHTPPRRVGLTQQPPEMVL